MANKLELIQVDPKKWITFKEYGWKKTYPFWYFKLDNFDKKELKTEEWIKKFMKFISDKLWNKKEIYASDIKEIIWFRINVNKLIKNWIEIVEYISSNYWTDEDEILNELYEQAWYEGSTYSGIRYWLIDVKLHWLKDDFKLWKLKWRIEDYLYKQIIDLWKRYIKIYNELETKKLNKELKDIYVSQIFEYFNIMNDNEFSYMYMWDIINPMVDEFIESYKNWDNKLNKIINEYSDVINFYEDSMSFQWKSWWWFDPWVRINANLEYIDYDLPNQDINEIEYDDLNTIKEAFYDWILFEWEKWIRKDMNRIIEWLEKVRIEVEKQKEDLEKEASNSRVNLVLENFIDELEDAIQEKEEQIKWLSKKWNKKLFFKEKLIESEIFPSLMSNDRKWYLWKNIYVPAYPFFWSFGRELWNKLLKSVWEITDSIINSQSNSNSRIENDARDYTYNNVIELVWNWDKLTWFKNIWEYLVWKIKEEIESKQFAKEIQNVLNYEITYELPDIEEWDNSWWYIHVLNRPKKNILYKVFYWFKEITVKELLELLNYFYEIITKTDYFKNVFLKASIYVKDKENFINNYKKLIEKLENDTITKEEMNILINNYLKYIIEYINSLFFNQVKVTQNIIHAYDSWKYLEDIWNKYYKWK